MTDFVRFAEKITSDLKKSRMAAADALVRGVPSDISQYREQVGLVRGMDQALLLIEETKKAWGKDDDEEV